MSLSILQITDVHLVGAADGELCHVNTQHTLERVLESALETGTPDAIVATGDIAHDAEAGVYRRFLETVRARFAGPLLCTPGNHDLWAPMQLAGLPMDDLDLGGWMICALDSHLDDHEEAEVADVEVQQLKVRMGDARNVLIVTHHHIEPVGCPWLDWARIQSPTLLEFAAENEAVRGVAFGHVHQEVDACLADRPLFGTPSTCFQFQPRSERFAMTREAPGWRWLTLEPSGRIRSQVQRVAGLTLNPYITQDS